jgi:hypothetical protein
MSHPYNWRGGCWFLRFLSDTSENSRPELEVKTCIGFSYGGIVIKNLVEVTNFECDELYQSINRALEMQFRNPPFHREIIWWLKKSSICHAHGSYFHFMD